MDYQPSRSETLSLQPPWLRRSAAWLLHVDSPDIVRYTLNQALILALAGFFVLGIILFIVVALVAFDRLVLLIVAGTVLLIVPLIVLAKRGSTLSGLILAIVVAITNTLIFTPASYVDPPVVHVAFLLPVLLASLFIDPWIGLLFVPLQAAFLAIAMLHVDVSNSVLLLVVFYIIVDLTAVGLPIAVAAQLLRRAIAAQRTQANRLDELVGQRTAELQRLIRIREQDTTAAAHDINNRLLVVRAELDLLLAEAGDFGLDPQVLLDAETRLNRSLLAVRDLADDLRTAALLDHAGLQLELRSVDVAAITAHILAQYQSEARLAQCRLELRVEAMPPAVLGDARRIERVLANVIGNAIKYSRQVAVERRHVLVQVRAHNQGSSVTVIDQGPGLSAAELALLGRPFTRLNGLRGEDGMGLGIYISRGIVELHGGQLHYASAGPGCGVRAELWLPAAPSGIA